MRLNSIKQSNTDPAPMYVSGFEKATALLLEQERVREEKARKRKHRFSWHFA